MIGKQPLIVGNWKMNLGVRESVQLARNMLEGLEAPRQTEVAIAPSALALFAVAEVLRDTPFKLTAQNVAALGAGAHTGEVASEHLAELGVAYAIIGHSERRIEEGEDDAVVALKVAQASMHLVIPILCVGETKAERRAGKTKSVLKRQLAKGLMKIKSSAPLVIAYEPVWAIGGKKAAPLKEIRAAHEFIKKTINRSARIMYGGAVDAAEAALLAKEPLVDGLLVGHASLDATAFRAIIQAYENR